MAAVKAEGKCVNVGNCLRWISKNVNGGVYFFFLEQDCFALNSSCRFGKVGYAYYMGPH